MKKVTFEVEKISNGFLFTETNDTTKGEKVFNEHKANFFDILKENKNIGGLIEEDEEIIILEITRQDISTARVEPDIHVLKDAIVEKDVYSPFPKKDVNAGQIRLSVNKNNAYSESKLLSIDWNDLDEKLPMNARDKAEIAGHTYNAFYQSDLNRKKGKNVFRFEQTRIYYTVLAKYYEAVLGIQHTKKDEIIKLQTGIKEQVNALEIIFKRNNHIHSNSVEPILLALKALLKEE